MSPGFAPTNALEARADEIKACDDKKISLGAPVVPEVPITTAACVGPNSELTSPNPRVGPLPARAAVMSLAKRGVSHAGLTRRIFRCDELSIAVVGYR